MQQALRPSALVPLGFVVEDATCDGATTVITVRRASRSSPCPGCGTNSERIHSRYLRRVADLPLAGRPVRLVVVARRFRCGADLCGRRIFTERFEDGVLAPWARRTGRLDYVIHHLGLALGGRPAASFARRLMLPVSNDTLLRVVRRRGSPSIAPPTVVGIDDWAWRRSQRYGTIICDLERRKTIALLPDREPATAEAWLSGQPQISVVARDRGGGYALAAAKALPNARLPTAGTSWRTPVAPFLTPFRNPCGRSVPRSAPQRSIPACSRLPSVFNMKATSVEKRPMPPFLDWQRTGSPSRRSYAAPDTAAASFAMCCGDGARMSSAPERVRSNRIFNGSTRNGLQAFVTARSYEGTSSGKGSAGRCGSSPNGLLAADGRKRQRRKACDKFLPPGPSHEC